MDNQKEIEKIFQQEAIKQVPGGEHGYFMFSTVQNSFGVANLSQQNCLFQSEEDRNIYYFNMFFSPKQTTQSLKRRNDNLQMLNFQNSDEEPDDVFNRRKKKVVDLINKQQEQLSVIMKIKAQDQGKFLAIIQFIKFFCIIKQKLIGTRTDYYSSKTFSALKNANSQQLGHLTKVVQRMYSNIMKQSKPSQAHSKSTSSQSNRGDQRILQFLIIPRFLISKQKINRLSRDEILQKNFQFLVFHQCLGHYNNQANKKMPEQTQMIYVRQLLTKQNGRQKFKKICSINHGNKFFKNHPHAYYELYSKSLQYLRVLDNQIKKGKKYESIKKQLDKMPSQTDDAFLNLSLTDNESSNNSLYNFRNINQCLNKIENSENQSSIKSQMRDQFQQNRAEFIRTPMKKNNIKKLMSMPQADQKQQQRPRGFSVRKSQTMQPRTTTNIILIPPQFNYES